jgi:hypothetical protein
MTLLTTIAAWSFAGDGYTDYLLVIVTGFVAVAVALPLILSRVGQPAGAGPTLHDSFRAWAAGDLDTSRIGSRAPTRPLKFCCRWRPLRSA